MKITNNLDKIKLTRCIIENQIKDYKLQFYREKDDMVEWQIKFPTFLIPFYAFIIKNQRIPSQFNFYSYYHEHNTNNKVIKELNENLRIPFKARLYRAYPSFVRDVHFAFYLKECKEFDNVIYNAKYDVEYGVDLIVEKNNKTYGLNLFTNTSRAIYARKKKVNRHEKVKDIIPIDVPIDFNKNKLGDFFLYGEKELNKILNVIG